MKVFIFTLSLMAFSFGTEKNRADGKFYFVDVLQHRDLKPDGKEYGSDKGLVFGLLGKSFKKGDLPLKEMKLMTDKGVDKVQFESVVKNCREYLHPFDSSEYKICQDFAVYKYPGSSKPIMLFKFPHEVKNVDAPEWKPIADWDSVKSLLLKEENTSSLIESDFQIITKKEVDGKDHVIKIIPKGVSKPSKVFNLNDLNKSCGGSFYLNWVGLNCSTIRLFFLNDRYIISSLYSKTGVEHSSRFNLEASFSLLSGKSKYYVFTYGGWIFGKMKIYNEGDDSGFVAVENEFTLDPMDEPVMP